jgi:hypothetical protein
MELVLAKIQEYEKAFVKMESKVQRFDEVNYDLKILRNDYEILEKNSQQILEELSKQGFRYDKLLMNYAICMFELDRNFVEIHGDINKIDKMDLGGNIGVGARESPRDRRNRRKLTQEGSGEGGGPLSGRME